MKIFLLLDPPTVTAQMNKVAIVNNKPVFYKSELIPFSCTLCSL